MPRIEKRIYIAIAAAVGFCAASFIWLHDISNSRLELEISRTYVDKNRMDRVENKLDDLTAAVASSSRTIEVSMQRFVSELREMRGNK